MWSSEGLGVMVGECSAGFQIPALGLVVLCEEEIFGAQRRRLRRPLFQRGAAIASFNDLAPNDLVVHEQHGIARYHGLRTLSSDGHDADFLLLEYAEGGRLYLPVERLDLISKYMGAPEGCRAPRSPGRRGLAAAQGVGAGRAARDGGGAAQALREALGGGAGPLLRRYPVAARVRGARSASRRRPDQMRAIDDVKSDMDGRAPDGPPGRGRRGLRQDRGGPARRVPRGGRRPAGRGAGADHGAGPAALQHVRGALRRRSRPAWSCSRASAAPRSRSRWWQGLAAGAVDVVIGTHRLLSKDVAVQEPGPAGGRRGAPLRGHPQGAAQAAAHLGRRAHPHRDPDPAHPAHGAVRRARPLGDRDAAARPAAGGDGGDRASAAP